MSRPREEHTPTEYPDTIVTIGIDTGTRTRGRLTHEGPCGPRIPCWRPECRATFSDYRTVEILAFAQPPDPDFDVVCYCHREKIRAGELDGWLANLVADVMTFDAGTVAR